jgi:RNA polymerase sigma-70 factor (ECF subfamily)
MEARSTPRAVRDLQAGINAAENFDLLFRRYYRLLEHFFRRRRCSAEQAEDLLQETYLRVYRGVGCFRHEARFETWLLKIASSVFNDLVCRKASSLGTPLEVAITTSKFEAELTRRVSQSAAANPLERAVRRERRMALRAAIQDMPHQMRCCIALRVSQGLRYREIAEVMKVSVNVVRVQLFRARRRLEDKLGESSPTCSIGGHDSQGERVDC